MKDYFKYVTNDPVLIGAFLFALMLIGVSLHDGVRFMTIFGVFILSFAFILSIIRFNRTKR